jgi:hypothetical protein
MTKGTQPLIIRSADLQEGIEYEVKREIVNMKIAKKIDKMHKDGSLYNPSDEDIAELRQLVASR